MAIGTRVSALISGDDVEAGAQAVERAEIEFVVAPLHLADRLEIVALERDHQFLLERIGVAGDAERAVVHVAPGAAGDLAELRRRQRPCLVAVELAVVGERHVMHVEIEPHADGVGGDEKIDVAILVHVDLGIAGTGRERAHHHCSAAALAPDEFGDGVDLARRERDDRRARRLPRDLLAAGIESASRSAAGG